MRVVYSRQYRTARATLSPATRWVLNFAEEEIANDPSLGYRRRQLDDGSIIDFSAEDLVIRYRLLSDEVVEFERVIDLRAQS